MKFSIIVKLTGLVLLFISNSIQANTFSLAGFHEHNGENRASGASVTMASPTMQFGASLNEITSNIALESNDRHFIHPVYIFGNISLDTRISPYFEFGVDLGELIIDELINGDEDGGGFDVGVDVYWSFGVKTKFNRTMDVSAYTKFYHLEYRENEFSALKHLNLQTYGTQILFHF